MIEIYEPRYRDRAVLVAGYKIAIGYPIDIRIKKGAYKGDYRASSNVVYHSPCETMHTRSGKDIIMRAIPLDKLERLPA
jgi:hypothetical protein